MKRMTFFLAFTLTSVFMFAQFPLIEIGDKVPLSDLKMRDISGKMISLDEVKMEKGTLVIFSCNACPFVLAWEDRYPALKTFANEHKIGFVLINSNAANSNGVDSFEAMQKHAKKSGYNSYYAVDKNSKLANAFGAKTTPHVFLFNGAGNLAFMGAIDDNHKDAKQVKKDYLKNAISNLAAGEEITLAVTRATGCGIKRK